MRSTLASRWQLLPDRDMISLGDPRRYRREAAKLREIVLAIGNTADFRDSSLTLARQYERLAQILEKGNIAIVGEEEASAMIVLK
jgi:hypothetical protein